MIGRLGRSAISVSLSFIMLAVAASRSEAQTKLRYRFTAGESIGYELEHDTRLFMESVTGHMMNIGSEMHFDMTCDVAAVAPDGKAKLVIRFDRIRFRLAELPATSLTEYDTDAQTEPTDPFMKKVFSVLKSLIGPAVELNMDARGNMTDFKVVERASTALAKLPEQSGEMLNDDGLKRLLAQAWLVLPEEAVAKDKPWHRGNEVKLTDGPPQNQFAVLKTDTAFTWDGKKEVGGKSLDHVAAKSSITVVPDERFVKQGGLNIVVRDQSGEGEDLFDAAAGRLVETSLKQRASLSISVGTMNIDEFIFQNSYLKLKPKSK